MRVSTRKSSELLGGLLGLAPNPVYQAGTQQEMDGMPERIMGESEIKGYLQRVGRVGAGAPQGLATAQHN